MVQVKDLTEVTVRELWREFKDEEDWWDDLKEKAYGWCGGDGEFHGRGAFGAASCGGGTGAVGCAGGSGSGTC